MTLNPVDSKTVLNNTSNFSPGQVCLLGDWFYELNMKNLLFEKFLDKYKKLFVLKILFSRRNYRLFRLFLFGKFVFFRWIWVLFLWKHKNSFLQFEKLFFFQVSLRNFSWGNKSVLSNERKTFFILGVCFLGQYKKFFLLVEKYFSVEICLVGWCRSPQFRVLK